MMETQINTLTEQDLRRYLNKKIKLNYSSMFGLNSLIGNIKTDTEGNLIFYELHKRTGFYLFVDNRFKFFSIEVLK